MGTTAWEVAGGLFGKTIPAGDIQDAMLSPLAVIFANCHLWTAEEYLAKGKPLTESEEEGMRSALQHYVDFGYGCKSDFSAMFEEGKQGIPFAETRQMSDLFGASDADYIVKLHCAWDLGRNAA